MPVFPRAQSAWWRIVSRRTCLVFQGLYDIYGHCNCVYILNVGAILVEIVYFVLFFSFLFRLAVVVLLVSIQVLLTWRKTGLKSGLGRLNG